MSTPSSIVGEQNSSGNVPARNLLPVLAFGRGHLGGVLQGMQPGQVDGGVAVEVPEERDHAGAPPRPRTIGGPGPRRPSAVPGVHGQGAGVEPPSGDAAVAYLGHQPVLCEDLDQ